jgi:hypothetical protein
MIRANREASGMETRRRHAAKFSWTRAAQEDMDHASRRDNFSRHPRARVPRNT